MLLLFVSVVMGIHCWWSLSLRFKTTFLFFWCPKCGCFHFLLLCCWLTCRPWLATAKWLVGNFNCGTSCIVSHCRSKNWWTTWGISLILEFWTLFFASKRTEKSLVCLSISINPSHELLMRLKHSLFHNERVIPWTEIHPSNLASSGSIVLTSSCHPFRTTTDPCVWMGPNSAIWLDTVRSRSGRPFGLQKG